MYRKSNSYSKVGVDISRFVNTEGGIADIANSTLLSELDKCEVYQYYKVTKYEHRIDLIAKEIYGNSDYGWILLYLNRISIADIVRDLDIIYIPMDTLSSLLRIS